MTISRPTEIGAGDEVRLGDRTATVVAVTGTGMQLRDITGQQFTITRGELLASPGFQVITARTAPLPPSGLLDGIPEEAAEKARWRERHIAEVLTGTSPGTAEPRPEYDPMATTLRQRELAKVAELRSAGHQVALRTFQRMRRSYETSGLWGLVDGRLTRPSTPTGKANEKVVDAVRQAVREQTDASTGTVDRVRRRTEQILAAAGTDPADVMPSRAGFYRLVKSVSEGRHIFGSAGTRRSLAKQPDGPFGTVTAFRPGQWMQIDSSPLNIAVRLDNGLTDRAELTWIIDLATRSIPAAVLSPSAKSVDAALLLARCLTPELMRPGWADALRMSRSVLPHRRLAGIDQRLADAAARPVIVPGTIVCDHGNVFMSQAFRNACRAMGINFQPTHKGSPWEKGTVETSFNAVDTLFAQYVAGYVGNSVENRGTNAEQAAAWSIVELQDLLDEWIVVLAEPAPRRAPRSPGFRNRAHPEREVRGPHRGRRLCPGPAVAGRLHRAADGRVAGDQLLRDQDQAPEVRQQGPAPLPPGAFRRHGQERPVGSPPRPYDVSRIWVRNHREGGWIEATWTYLNTGPVPFGDLAWDHAQRMLARRGIDKPTEDQIAQAARDLLDRAEKGPGDPPGEARPAAAQSRQDLRAAARTRATTSEDAKTAWPGRALQEPGTAALTVGEAGTQDGEEHEEERLAKVIPLGVFDAAEEAKKRW